MIYTCSSLKEMKKLMNARKNCSPDNTILVSMSCVIDPKEFPDEYITFFLARPLYPNNTTMALFYSGEDYDAFEDACMQFWAGPSRLVYINEVLYRAIEGDKDIIWVISEDESDFKFDKFIREFLDRMYSIKAMKASKALKEKKFPKKDIPPETQEMILNTRANIMRMSNDLNFDIHPLLFMRLPKKLRKNLPKPLKKLTKELIESEWK